ncbi:RAD9, HUS1, RAD1-interacting nuclear orphan protein 1 [Xenopus laevis]|uniref:Uncharacterized protein n=2 Tax=Xenopus laevis TaxID=8355 RepID=A0A974HS77_XENLA|nr:RAD9, HUS1, RAD1-interacting nuclear orphan protein 1 [Xenopus laevis]OCT88128.1 hypothetical protein XELAEV_18016759mg [Xenopus laevis]
MPRKKKQSECYARKPRLLFVESPKRGLCHKYELPPHMAVHPVCAPTRPLDHNASTSWVCPQFDQAEELHFSGRRRLRYMFSNRTLQNRKRDGNRSKLRGSGIRPGACKLPSLSFTKVAPDTPRKRPGGKTTAPLSSPPQEVPSTPDVQTPETSLNCNQSTDLPNGIPVSRSPDRGQDEQRDGFDSPVLEGLSRVLVKDTPEREYGLKNT